ncbi:hypothetical protein CAMGR0001_2068 [Campylobacter gracilis RM3268]|uniref:Uncharacterized protein n=1 Tax=Campylobacter gracilis RM3268 TaxID=553220 RepID=C8PLQ8_9BACT|nr:hypothetical protein CAMGR0001_2068 [Campylobacter gracilis RM3268]
MVRTACRKYRHVASFALSKWSANYDGKGNLRRIKFRKGVAS